MLSFFLNSNLPTRRHSPHNGDVQIGNIFQAELNELLVLFLSQPADEALRRKLLAILERGETVLRKDVVELVGKVRGSDLQLFTDLLEIAASYNANDALLAKLREESVEFGRDGLTGERECTVNIEKAEHARLLTVAVAGCHPCKSLGDVVAGFGSGSGEVVAVV